MPGDAEAPGGPGGALSPLEASVCRAALDSLMGKGNAKKNYLFLEPVDLAHFPTYTDVVERPMDLGTVGKNLEGGGGYGSMGAFWADVHLVFANAIRFHQPNPEAAWIVKLARDMAKVVERERRKADKKLDARKGGGGGATGRGGSIVSGATLKRKRAGAAGGGGGDQGGRVAPVVKLKLSSAKAVAGALASAQVGDDDGAAAGAGGGGKGSGGRGGKAAKKTAAKAKPSKPKLSLKLSLGGGGGGGGGSASPRHRLMVEGGEGSPDAAATSSAGPRGGAVSSRGKQLPTPVHKTKDSLPKPKLRLSISDSKAGPVAGVAKSAGKVAGRAKKGQGKKGARGGMGMNLSQHAACSRVLSALTHRSTHDNIVWFLKPVVDPVILNDYRSKIKNPIDLGTIGTKLAEGKYHDVERFVLDLRRVFANCLRYNTSINDSFRAVARNTLTAAESILSFFIPASTHLLPMYPRLMYCWKLALSVLDTLVNMTNPGDGNQTAHFFLHPVSYYFGGEDSPSYVAYVAKIKKPMDFGTITTNLIEGIYEKVEEFVADCRLVCDNCREFYANQPGGETFVELSDRLKGLMQQQLGALVRYDSSSQAAAVRATPVAPLAISRPSPASLLAMLTELKETKYTDKFTKLPESATLPFQQPVNVTLFPDYTRFVRQPMDLQTIEAKINGGVYVTPEDFEYDCNLVWGNCDLYNVPKKNTHIVGLGRHCNKVFRKLYSKRMAALLERGGVEHPSGSPGLDSNKRPSSAMADGDASGSQQTKKRIKLDTSSVPKATPRITLTASQIASAPVRSRSPTRPPRQKSKDTDTAAPSDEPVPLHVAIARIKESFPLRRPHKMLKTGWEGACSRFFRELSRHPWLSASRPRFVFHVPVPLLFPSIREAYAEKIKSPMDLTTAEAKLLQGGIYLGAQEFVDDIGLIFTNAMTFNRPARDEGDPTSCAYYDASKHLLRYARWLSLEYLADFLSEDAQSDPPNEEGLVIKWSLTKANRKFAREEMEGIALKSPLELSEEDERYFFMETECEKLLKSLRHQSDAKHMHWFVQAIYPPDYQAFISRPMAWEQCNDNLQNGRYDSIGQLTDDLRLIFSNALKYNARGRGTETVSGRAYDSAVLMSRKLEAAIDKLLLIVGNRLETERVDQSIQEREAEAEERAEEERLRLAWQQEVEDAKAGGGGGGEGGGGGPGSGSSGRGGTERTTVERIRIVQLRRPQRRASAFDFDFPFNDDEGDAAGQEPSQLDALRQQKAIFERQRAARAGMFRMASAIGFGVYERMREEGRAIRWARRRAAERRQKKREEEKEEEEEGEGEKKEKGERAAEVDGMPFPATPGSGSGSGDPAALAEGTEASRVGGQDREQVRVVFLGGGKNKRRRRRKRFPVPRPLVL